MSNINIKLCRVLDTNDPNNSGRIKARLYPEDKDNTVDKIPYAYPLLPKMFNVLPKEGEGVIIFLTETGNGYSNRYYIGPIISQLPNLEFDGYDSTAFSNYPDYIGQPLVKHDEVNDAIGAFGEKEDITIYGRKGSDIILKEDDIRIRAGSRIDSNNKIGKGFNRLNPSYLKLKYSETPIVIGHYEDDKFIQEKKYNSTATLVADEINLISNQSSTNFNVTDNKELITNDEMEKIIRQAHVLPYGDVLVQFLKRFLWEFQNHTHTFPGKLTALNKGHEDIYEYDFDSMLSKNVRIN